MAAATMDPYAKTLLGSSGFGAKMMASMGWQVGKGIGKDEDGRVNIVTVTKREEGVGIGVGIADTADDSIKVIKNTFSSISNKIQIPSDSDDDDTDTDSDSEDEEESKMEELIRAQAGNCATDEEIKLLRACGGRGAGGGQGGHGGAMARLGKLRRVGAEEKGVVGGAAAIALGAIQRDENGLIIVPDRQVVVHKRVKKKKVKGSKKDKKDKKKKGKKEKAGKSPGKKSKKEKSGSKKKRKADDAAGEEKPAKKKQKKKKSKA
jgi:hypothetical protein